MMTEKDDLGLNLSLGFPQNKIITPKLVTSSSSSSLFALHKRSWNDSFISSAPNSEIYRPEAGSFLKGIDVNRLPSNGDCGEEVGVSSPNSTVSSVSGKRSERECNGSEDLELDRSCSRGISDEEDGDTSRKKLRLSKDQSAVLEETFKEHSTLNPKQKLALAKKLGLRPRQVEVWFQNRRARTKLKQTEVDCEFLRRCCENLTDENRRLQKEVAELRALKMSPQFYMQMAPPTTLTMCPSCERVSAPPPSTAMSAPLRSSAVDPWPAPAPPAAAHMAVSSSVHHRPIPMNPWAPGGPLSRRPFDGLRPQS